LCQAILHAFNYNEAAPAAGGDPRPQESGRAGRAATFAEQARGRLLLLLRAVALVGAVPEEGRGHV